MLSSAATDCLLVKLCAVKELVLQSSVRPRCIPESVEILSICSYLGPQLDPGVKRWQADAVLNRCERLHSLQKLSLHFVYGSEVKLTSRVQLGSLRSVTLGFAMTVEDPRGPDLAWIGQQSLQRLDLSILVHSSRPSKHATVVQHLEQLNMRKHFDQVRLAVTVPFPRNIQVAWSALNIWELTITVWYDGPAFGTADLALQVLPASCSRVQIKTLEHICQCLFHGPPLQHAQPSSRWACSPARRCMCWGQAPIVKPVDLSHSCSSPGSWL